MSTKLTTHMPPAVVDPEATATPREAPVDWERAFVALTAMTCTGFVTTRQVEQWVQTIRDQVDPRAAEVMVSVFNRTRSKWMQDFMG